MKEDVELTLILLPFLYATVRIVLWLAGVWDITVGTVIVLAVLFAVSYYTSLQAAR